MSKYGKITELLTHRFVPGMLKIADGTVGGVAAVLVDYSDQVFFGIEDTDSRNVWIF